jgi:hypothetical protein
MADELNDLCSTCGDAGWIVGPCFEDVCCCEDPDTHHRMIPCPDCNPENRSAKECYEKGRGR